MDFSWYVPENCTWFLLQMSLQTLDLVLFCFILFHLFWSLLIHTWGWFDFSCKYVCRHWQTLDPFLFHFDFISLFDLSWYALDDYYWFFSWIFLWTFNYLDISWIVFMFLVNYLRGLGDWHIVWGCLVKGLIFSWVTLIQVNSRDIQEISRTNFGKIFQSLPNELDGAWEVVIEPSSNLKCYQEF